MQCPIDPENCGNDSPCFHSIVNRLSAESVQNVMRYMKVRKMKMPA